MINKAGSLSRGLLAPTGFEIQELGNLIGLDTELGEIRTRGSVREFTLQTWMN